MKPTFEKWTCEDHEHAEFSIYGERGIRVAHGLSKPDAKRIVKCVNACAGIDPAGIPDAVRLVKLVHDLYPSPETKSVLKNLKV